MEPPSLVHVKCRPEDVQDGFAGDYALDAADGAATGPTQPPSYTNAAAGKHLYHLPLQRRWAIGPKKGSPSALEKAAPCDDAPSPELARWPRSAVTVNWLGESIRRSPTPSPPPSPIEPPPSPSSSSAPPKQAKATTPTPPKQAKATTTTGARPKPHPKTKPKPGNPLPPPTPPTAAPGSGGSPADKTKRAATAAARSLAAAALALSERALSTDVMKEAASRAAVWSTSPDDIESPEGGGAGSAEGLVVTGREGVNEKINGRCERPRARSAASVPI